MYDKYNVHVGYPDSYWCTACLKHWTNCRVCDVKPIKWSNDVDQNDDDDVQQQQQQFVYNKNNIEFVNMFVNLAYICFVLNGVLNNI